MVQTILGIAVVVGFFSIGLKLVRHPQASLATFDRPATDQHIRAARFIGGGFLIFVLLALVQLFRGMH